MGRAATFLVNLLSSAATSGAGCSPSIAAYVPEPADLDLRPSSTTTPREAIWPGDGWADQFEVPGTSGGTAEWL